MISRYTNPEMGRIWSDQRKYETWLQVELAAVEAMARAGIVPEEAAREIRGRAAFSVTGDSVGASGNRLAGWKALLLRIVRRRRATNVSPLRGKSRSSARAANISPLRRERQSSTRAFVA